MVKRPLIFVGHARHWDKNINPGGFSTASRLLFESDFFEQWKTIIVDVSSKAFPREASLRLVTRGIRRVLTFTVACLKSRAGVAFIFAAHGGSFIEKIIMCGVGLLFGVRCSLYICSGHFMEAVRATKVPLFYKWALNIPKLLICPSPTWVHLYNKIGISEEKLVVVPNWIDVHTYAACRKAQPMTDEVTFIFVGMLIAEKGVYEFVEAAGRIRNQVPSARWMVVGGGPEEAELRRLADAAGLSDRILFTGWATTEKVIECLKEADVLVLPTHADAFPNVILEAMAAGLPVITTKVGGIPGFIRDGQNGILVPPRDSNMLANAMTSLARDPELRKALSSAGLEYVSRVHDSQVVLAELGAVLVRL